MKGKRNSEATLLQVEKVTESTSKYVIEFDYIDPNPNDGMTRLRVTVQSDGLTVHDVWDKKAADLEVDWMDLRRIARSVRKWEEEVSKAKLTRQTVNGMLRELQCVVALRRRERSPCQEPPRCNVPIVFLGPAPRGERERCDVDPCKWPTLSADSNERLLESMRKVAP